MKITNKSVKVINIGTRVIMPGADIEVTSEIANLPAVKAMARMGLLEIINTPAQEPVAQPVPEVEQNAEKETAEAIQEPAQKTKTKRTTAAKE